MSSPYNPGGHGRPDYNDPYSAQPRTNLYGQPLQPRDQPPNPYGPYAGTYGVQAYPQRPVKSKAAAGLLAFFLGQLGVHWFYLGRKGLGFAHLTLAVVVMVMMFMALTSIASATGVPESAAVSVVVGNLLWMVNGLWALGDLVYILVKPESELGR